MADAVEATRQDMKQEAADELVRCERHDALPLGPIAAVVFVAEGTRSREAGSYMDLSLPNLPFLSQVRFTRFAPESGQTTVGPLLDLWGRPAYGGTAERQSALLGARIEDL